MARKRSKRVSAAGYRSLMRSVVKLRRSGNRAAWTRARKRASAYRKRLVAANRRHPSQRMGSNRACGMMSADSKALYDKLTKASAGQKVAKLFRSFWKLPCPPSVRLKEGGPKGRTEPLLDMGHTLGVYLATKDKGQRGNRQTVVRGRWTVATEKTGRRILLLSSRPVGGKWVAVGYAPETHYIPPQDVERAGTHKAGLEWRHRHGVDDKKIGIPRSELHWPRVFADRGGKVDANSNFMYGVTPTAKVRDWMYGN